MTNEDDRLREARQAVSRLTTMTAAMVRGTGVCETGHKRGVEHYHFDTIHAHAANIARDLPAIRAALAATPTQSGAEGPAERLTGLPWLREAVKQVRLNGDGTVSIDLNTWNVLHLYAFRSGAEVAAAPGLDVGLVKQAVTNIAIRHQVAKDPPPPSWSLMKLYGYTAAPADMDAEIAAEYERLALAARLTAKP